MRQARSSISPPSLTATTQENAATLPQLPSWVRGGPLCVVRQKKNQIPMLNFWHIHQSATARFGRKRGTLLLLLSFLGILMGTFALAKRYGTHEKQWPGPFTGDTRTLVFKREDLQRIWLWEIASGHYPSRRSSEQIVVQILETGFNRLVFLKTYVHSTGMAGP